MESTENTMSSPLYVNADVSTVMTDDLSYSDESKTLKYRNRTVMLYLNNTHILIHDVKTMKKNIDLSLDDVIGCEATQSRAQTVFYLKIYAYPKRSSCCSSNFSRVPRTYSVAFDDKVSVLNWVNAVKCSIQGVPLSYVSTAVEGGTSHHVKAPPKRKFLCVVNPFSGKVCNVTTIHSQLATSCNVQPILGDRGEYLAQGHRAHVEAGRC